MPEPVNPIRPTDDDARALARALLSGARHAALAVLHPDTGAPFVSRIALGLAVGIALETADEVTLARALEGRRKV